MSAITISFVATLLSGLAIGIVIGRMMHLFGPASYPQARPRNPEAPDFPPNPVDGQTYHSGGREWAWRGICWKLERDTRQQPCPVCNGSRIVPAGEISCSEEGAPFENGLIKCVKDCPACCGQGSMVEMTPPATARDQWMYKQGWVAARDPRSTNVVDAVIVLAGHHFKLRDLLERAMRNLHKPRRPRVRWAVVRDTFGLGSTVSAALCREFDLDPDESLEEGH